MMHPSDDILRAYIDRQLEPGDEAGCQAHLVDCSPCRERIEALQDQAERARVLLDQLAPLPRRIMRPAAAYQRLQQYQEKPTMLQKLFTPARRPLWTVLTVIAVLAIALTFQPVRAWASSLLDIFRVQQITVLPIDISALRDMRFNDSIAQTASQMFSQSVTFDRKPSDPQTATDAADAAKLAGFALRLPTGPQPERLTVDQGFAFHATIDLAQAQSILDAAVPGKFQLPASLDGQTVSMDVPARVSAAYGADCRFSRDNPGSSTFSTSLSKDCTMFIQMPSPTIQTPPEINVSQLANMGLQVLGMSADEAKTLSTQIDWTSTLVLPIPRGTLTSADMPVDGVTGKLLQQANSQDSLRQGYVLIWVKNGIIYAVAGTGDPAAAVTIGNSLK